METSRIGVTSRALRVRRRRRFRIDGGRSSNASKSHRIRLCFAGNHHCLAGALKVKISCGLALRIHRGNRSKPSSSFLLKCAGNVSSCASASSNGFGGARARCARRLMRILNLVSKRSMVIGGSVHLAACARRGIGAEKAAIASIESSAADENTKP